MRTDRLLLRAPRPSDSDHLAERRNDPEVAEYQNWSLPYSTDQARAEIARVMAMSGPTNGDWWMMTIADAADSTVFGDIVCHLGDNGHTAEIGYSLARSAWGRGYAADAAGALVDLLFDTIGVTRVQALLHPANTASAMVLERIGMLFEGHTRLSFRLGDDTSDDWIYGMIRDDRDAWRDRPRHRPGDVRLAEITSESVHRVGRLATHKSQEQFVAPVGASFGDALFPEVIDGAPLEPWLRAIEADGETVGFAMLARSTDVHPEPYLWRLLIDRVHQRRGIGTAALDRIVEQCRRWGDGSLLTSWVPGKGSPEPMYLRYGFEPTGRIVDGEIEGRLTVE